MKKELYNYDLPIPEEVILKDFGMLNELYEHTLRSLRSKNYYVYKVELLQHHSYLGSEEDMVRGITRYRFYCAKLGEPEVLI